MSTRLLIWSDQFVLGLLQPYYTGPRDFTNSKEDGMHHKDSVGNKYRIFAVPFLPTQPTVTHNIFVSAKIKGYLPTSPR